MTKTRPEVLRPRGHFLRTVATLLADMVEPPDDDEEVYDAPPDPRAVAVHEAGHAVVRHYFGLRTPYLVMRPDGTGMTFGGGGLILDLEVRLTITLAGYAAEQGAYGDWKLLMLEPMVRGLRRSLAKDPGNSHDYFGFVRDATATNPRITDAELLTLMQRTHDRAVAILRERWDRVDALAERLLAAPQGSLQESEILDVLGPIEPRSPGLERHPPG